MTAYPTERIPIIIQMSPPSAPFSATVNLDLSQQAVNILGTNGQAVGALPIIEGAAGYATSAGIMAMSQLPQVASIDQDAVVRPRRPANTGSSWPAGNLTSLYPQEVQATSVWQQSAWGYAQPVTVAVLDSGVAPDVDLTDNSNRIVAQVNFAGPYDPQQPDPGGHGTHVAGTIAGDGTRSNGQYVGMDPHARIASVRVLDAKGNGRVSSVLRGLSWVIGQKKALNIRVVNLSFGAPPVGAYANDPLAAGVEVAWKNGIVVVAAAGNQGSGNVESPGTDPYVITVGATDDAGTLTLNDDTLAWFSSWGTPTASTQKPDMVAPGRKIVSIRVAGSTLDTLLPDHEVTAWNGSKYFRLTGTSMSTPIVSGAVALLLERNPSLNPNQVKQILMKTTQPFGQNATPPPAGAAGTGLLNCYTAYNSPTLGSADQGLRFADGGARLVYSLIYGGPLGWKDPAYQGINWLAYTWLTLPWTTPAWDNFAWDNIAWDNIAWDNIAWDQTSWDNIAWDNIAWDNTEWSNIAWDSFAFD
jgi:serine protease AprX